MGSPAVLQVIAWELSIAVALPTLLLVDMSERQQVEVALQVSEICRFVRWPSARLCVRPSVPVSLSGLPL